MKLSLFAGALLWLSCGAVLADRTYVVVTNTFVVNHWPGADGLIGTPDDPVHAGLSTYTQSSPNSVGTYTFIVTSLGFSPAPDPLLFSSYDTVTYVLGSVTIDPATFVTNDVPLVKEVQFSGTELFPGHGPYSLRVTNRRGGTYTHLGNVFTFTSRYDFEGSFAAGTATATNATASGLAVVLEPDDFDAPDLTGAPAPLAAYIRAVGTPLAKLLNARGLICSTMELETSGSVPETDGSFPPLKAYAVVLAMDLASALELRITDIQSGPDGVRIRWNPLPNSTYSVEATDSLGSPFTSLADNLTQTEYVDRTSPRGLSRYYRIRAPLVEPGGL